MASSPSLEIGHNSRSGLVPPHRIHQMRRLNTNTNHHPPRPNRSIPQLNLPPRNRSTSQLNPTPPNRPVPQRNSTHAATMRTSNFHLQHPQKSWEEIWIQVRNIPPARCNALDLHRIFLEYGHIVHINCQAQTAQILFMFHRPALFYKGIQCDGRKLYIHVVPRRPEVIEPALNPANPTKKKTAIAIEQLDFGIMTSERCMMTMHKVFSTEEHPALLILDQHGDKRHCIDVRFFLASGSDEPWYRFELRLNSPFTVLQVEYEDGHKELVIKSQIPPKWWQSIGSDLLEEVHRNNRDSRKYNDWPRGWRRVTDIELNPDERDLDPVSFIHPSPVIDTGRWLTWKIKFSPGLEEARYDAIIEALRDTNIIVEEVPQSRFDVVPKQDPVIWDLLDPHRVFYESDLHEMQDGMMHLSQDVRYQLEVCISNSKINEYNMDRDFFSELGSMDKQHALILLENVADSKRIFFDPMDIFTASGLRYSRKRRVPKDCVLMRTAVITPTTVYVKTPTVEVSNRVIRENSVAEGNFLRVKFEDEDIFGGLSPLAEYDNQHEVWDRIERCFRHGIDIAGRHYDWLACGNSQFRERGAYFFAPFDDKRTARNIRVGLGDFSTINVVAKCMARIGQCFSTTRAFNNVGQVEPHMIKDIERNGYCFTDGVGKISPFVAQMIANQFRVPSGPNHIPSVFQFRMGGYKGVLALDPTLKGRAVHLRPSQKKFETPNVGLEIIRISAFSTSTLNQQLILVLTGLGVPKQVFVKKMTDELQNIDLAMTDETKALAMLQKNVDFNQVTISIAGMILDGFMQSEEPFVQAVMELWRAWNLKHLKEKAKLPIKKGAFVLGCVDETNTLRMDADKLPEIFIQVPGDKEGEWKTPQGVCLLARNPSLHPGDIRVVRAVKCDGLKHLKNVVVLPQQGQRPLANMCSGGDLDGDDYLVMWDDDLLPPKRNWNHPPMDYDAPTPVTCAGPVEDDHFIKFFVDYIKHDSLGKIAVNHRAFADLHASEGGVKHETCLELAQLHSRAVDFNKTGVPAIMEGRRLWPQKYPHWIPGKAENRQYKSKEVLGVLFDMVQRVRFSPLLDKPFDKRVLDVYDLEDSMLEQARTMKHDYDKSIRRIMAQHAIKTEFEIWTAFVMDHNREKHWYSLAEEIGRLMETVRHTFQEAVSEAVGIKESYSLASEDMFQKIGPFVAAIYTVTAQEVEAWKNSKLVSINEDGEDRPLISFPWIFARELGKIATKDSGSSSLQAARAAGLSDLKQKTPTSRSRYQTELDRINLTPLEKWEPEIRAAVGDHVGNQAEENGGSEKKENVPLAPFQETQKSGEIGREGLSQELPQEIGNGPIVEEAPEVGPEAKTKVETEVERHGQAADASAEAVEHGDVTEEAPVIPGQIVEEEEAPATAVDRLEAFLRF